MCLYALTGIRPARPSSVKIVRLLQHHDERNRTMSMTKLVGFGPEMRIVDVLCRKLPIVKKQVEAS